MLLQWLSTLNVLGFTTCTAILEGTEVRIGHRHVRTPEHSQENNNEGEPWKGKGQHSQSEIQLTENQNMIIHTG